jgi:hypothetical protein
MRRQGEGTPDARDGGLAQPKWAASVRVDQWVAFSGTVSSVVVITS